MATIDEIIAIYNQLPRGANAALDSVAPALQFQAAQQAYQQGGVGGLLEAGMFPQANQAGSAAAGAATAGLRQQQGRLAGTEADVLGSFLGGGPASAGAGAVAGTGGGGALQDIGSLDQAIAMYNALGRTTEGLRGMRKPVALRGAFQQGDYFGGIEYLERRAPEFIPDYVKSSGGPNPESVRALGTRRGRVIDGLRELGGATAVIENVKVDPNNAKGWIYPFTIAVNKLLQEGAVLEGEARVVAEGQMALMEDLLIQAETLTDTDSEKAAVILGRLREMGLQLAEIKQRYTLDTTEGWNEEDERYRLRETERGQVHPGEAVRRKSREFLDRRDRAAQAPTGGVRDPGDMTAEERAAEIAELEALLAQ